jgi:hypothetical protein
MGGTIIGAEAFLSGCKTTPKKEGLFSVDDVSFLDEVGETILPATAGSPGAKEAQIGQFMKTIVTDCYDEDNQRTFTEGIGKLNDASKKKFDKAFMQLAPEQKQALLVDLDKESKDREKELQERESKLSEDEKHNRSMEQNAGTYKRKPEDDPHYFGLMKQLTVWGYFTSEAGATKALRYLPVPGRYEGCIPYKKGDKAWAL